MSILRDKLVSIAQRGVLKMISERGGSIKINLGVESVGEAGRKGVQALHKMGLVRLSPLIGESESYEVSLTDVGRRVVYKIIKNIGGGG